jgi:hypothetical protein
LNLCLGLTIDLSVLPTKILHKFKFSTYVPHSLYIIILYVITQKNIVNDWKSWTDSLWNFLQSPIFPCLLKSKNLPQYPIFKHLLPMLFSKYERLFSYLYNTARKIIIPYILFNIFLVNPPVVYFANIYCLNNMPRIIEWNLSLAHL